MKEGRVTALILTILALATTSSAETICALQTVPATVLVKNDLFRNVFVCWQQFWIKSGAGMHRKYVGATVLDKNHEFSQRIWMLATKLDTSATILDARQHNYQVFYRSTVFQTTHQTPQCLLHKKARPLHRSRAFYIDCHVLKEVD